MTVISHSLAFAGATGKISRGGKAEYTAHYRVTTSDKQDQAYIVQRYFYNTTALPHPDKSSTYSYGNDTDTAAVCDSLEPRRDANHPTEWTVVAHFGDVQSTEKGEDENGEPTDDPLEWSAVITHRTKVTKRPAVKGTYISGFGAGTDAIVAALPQPTAIVNSALQPFDPPAEKDYSTLLLSITKNVSDPISGEQMLNAENNLNLISFSVAHPSYNLQCPARHAKVNSIVPDRQRTNGISYWRVTTEIEIDFEQDWRLRLYDIGIFARAIAGDPDGEGGTISSVDIKDGDPGVRAITDAQGHPIAEPQLLNGDGQPLKNDSEPVELVWQIYPETVIQTFPWLSGVLV